MASKSQNNPVAKAYYRERKRVQQIVYRAKKSGITFDKPVLPAIPKRITKQSVYRLIKLTPEVVKAKGKIVTEEGTTVKGKSVQEELTKRANRSRIKKGEKRKQGNKFVKSLEKEYGIKFSKEKKKEIIETYNNTEINFELPESYDPYEPTDDYLGVSDYVDDWLSQHEQEPEPEPAPEPEPEYIPSFSITQHIRMKINALPNYKYVAVKGRASIRLDLSLYKQTMLNILNNRIIQLGEYGFEEYLIDNESEIMSLLADIIYDSSQEGTMNDITALMTLLQGSPLTEYDNRIITEYGEIIGEVDRSGEN